jgi:hypothetical protein
MGLTKYKMILIQFDAPYNKVHTLLKHFLDNFIFSLFNNQIKVNGKIFSGFRTNLWHYYFKYRRSIKTQKTSIVTVMSTLSYVFGGVKAIFEVWFIIQLSCEPFKVCIYIESNFFHYQKLKQDRYELQCPIHKIIFHVFIISRVDGGFSQ